MRPAGKDITGERIGRLLVLNRVPTPEGKKKQVYYLCQCDCGNTKILAASNLRSKSPTQSCGCLLDEARKNVWANREKPRGGDSTNPEYKGIFYCWERMIKRCDNPKDKRYSCYGGRGIKVCDEWYDYNIFREWALANGYKKGLSIERNDVNGNYEPSNCSWITMKEQARNKQNTAYATYHGETKTILEWSEITGIPYKTLHARLRRSDSNYTLEEAMTLPVGTPPKALKEKWDIYYNRGKNKLYATV